MMRMEQLQESKPNKMTQNSSNKVSVVVHKVLLPLLTAPIGDYVSFQVRDMNEADKQYFEHLIECDPSCVQDKESFLQKMVCLYDDMRR
jgi:hypothetical protein